MKVHKPQIQELWILSLLLHLKLEPDKDQIIRIIIFYVFYYYLLCPDETIVLSFSHDCVYDL